MRCISHLFLAAVWLAAIGPPFEQPVRADGVVADCSETSLLDALTGGGLVTFTQDCFITITAPIEISASTTIDAQGYSVTISGGSLVHVFTVDASTSLTLVGLTISDGQATNGAGLYINSSGTAVLTNCVLAGNHAVGTNGVASANAPDNPSASAGSGGNRRAGTPASGGAIFNLGNLTLLRCINATHSATGGTGGNRGHRRHGRVQRGK